MAIKTPGELTGKSIITLPRVNRTLNTDSLYEPVKSKQVAQTTRKPVHDDQLSCFFRPTDMHVGVTVADIQALIMEATEHSSNIRLIIDTDHHPALASPHKLSHALVLLEREVHTIASGLPVEWIHVEERMRSIVALGTVEPGQVLDVGTGEALPRGGQVLLDAQQVDGRPSGRSTERLPGDLAAEGVQLQVEEPSRTLDIGQDFGARHLLLFENLAKAEHPLEVAHELLRVVLHNAVKGDQVTVEIVQHLHGAGRGRMKNNAAPPAKTST